LPNIERIYDFSDSIQVEITDAIANDSNCANSNQNCGGIRLREMQLEYYQHKDLRIWFQERKTVIPAGRLRDKIEPKHMNYWI